MARISKGLLLRAAISLVLLTGVFMLQASLARTLELLANAQWPYLAAGIILAASGEVVTALKLKLLFHSAGHRPGMWEVTRSCFIAMFYNNFLPGSIGGDVARVFLLARSTGGKAVAAAGVFMQRNTGLAGLLVVALVASWLPPVRLALVERMPDWLNYVGVWFLFVAAGYVGVNLVLVSESLYRTVWDRLVPALYSAPVQGPPAPAGIFRRGVDRLLSILRRLHGSVRLFSGGWGIALALSVVTQLVDCTLVMLAGLALGVDLPFRFLSICVPAVILASLLPISLNGVGLRELVYVFLMRRIGVEESTAVAVSLIHFGVHLLLSLGGGLLQWVGAPAPVADERVEPKA